MTKHRRLDRRGATFGTRCARTCTLSVRIFIPEQCWRPAHGVQVAVRAAVRAGGASGGAGGDVGGTGGGGYLGPGGGAGGGAGGDAAAARRVLGGCPRAATARGGEATRAATREVPMRGWRQRRWRH